MIAALWSVRGALPRYVLDPQPPHKYTEPIRA